ncbi:hypothetical protein [Polycladidibacter stylochi]|uniref:hypothetical protein n=1 Tax=Polycladidibacter stylochi TaxID=1807766 RepID=UPI0008323B79|nr:hypothetical protein [Pseudovibrio stylochi]
MKPHILLTVIALVISCSTTPALAHKVIASVFASGSDIEGEIGFSNGEMAKKTLVEVFDEDGNKLGETRTDEEGFFVFTPKKAIPHVFSANLGSGHIAKVKLELADMPQVGSSNTDRSVSPIPELGSTAKVLPTQTIATNGSVNITMAELTEANAALLEETRNVMREMIHREVKPLRREIAAYKEKNNLQTILGGIGYIVGLFGFWFYFSTRRKLAKR